MSDLGWLPDRHRNIVLALAAGLVLSLVVILAASVLLEAGSAPSDSIRSSANTSSGRLEAAVALPAGALPASPLAASAGSLPRALPAAAAPHAATPPVAASGGSPPPKLPSSAPAASPFRASFSVPYTLAAGLVAGLLSPGASPPGANDWSCRPSAAHPEPVVLLHGLGGNMTDNWQTISPLLADEGYCVFALTYGTFPGAPFPLNQFGGLASMEQSAQTISQFIDRVLASTGAGKVDIVGHSEGATLPDYYVEYLGGAAKVDRYVGLAPVYHGTTLGGLAALAAQLAAALPAGSQAVAQLCGSCQEFLDGSAFIRKLDAEAAVPGVTYTNIVTRFDELVVPFTSGFLTGPNVTNIVVQDQCVLDLSDHVELAADPLVARDVLNALDPSHAEAPACGLVLPFMG